MNENENAEEGEGGREKAYSYNILRFASVAKVPVSNCVIALSYSCLNQQTWWGWGVAEHMWERANGRACSWVIERSCGCVRVRACVCTCVSQKCVVCAYDRNINDICVHYQQLKLLFLHSFANMHCARDGCKLS